MEKLFKYIAKVFGQDPERQVSTKTVIAYTMVTTTVFLWIWATLSKNIIPHVESLVSLDMVVFISYFGAQAASKIAEVIKK